MKKLLSLLVVAVMALGMFATQIAPFNTVQAQDEELRDVTMIVPVFHRAGYDRYGRPLRNGRYTEYDGVNVNTKTGRFTLDPGLPAGTAPTYDATDGVLFPWQYPGDDMWGRAGYHMPDCVKAIDEPGNGRINVAVTELSDDDWNVTPYLYTEVFLTVLAEGGESQLFDKRYIVMDNMGQVWIDPDGRFHDCRYWEPANPASTYYRSATVLSGDNTAQWNDCRTNPKMIVDPSGDNNTQGPYIFNPQYNSAREDYPAPVYHENVHYWWYDEDKGIDRVWKLGIANQTDYLREGAFSPDGVHISSGIVGGPDGSTPGAYYPGKPVLWNTVMSDSVTQRWCPHDSNIIAYDWDYNLPLANFTNQEFCIDVNGNNLYDFGEPIFLDADSNGMFDDLDLRLIAWTIVWGGTSFNFRKGTLVGINDEDYLWFLANGFGVIDLSTLTDIKHTSTSGASLYDQIYRDVDGDDLVGPNDVRITNINGRIDGMGITCGGFFMGDALIMLEVLKTSCSYKYNVHVQSDLWQVMQEDTYEQIEMYPSMTAAAFHSPNGDIVSMAQLVNKATALDDDGNTFYMPTTTFYNVALLYREFVGLQLFLDNGIDNNLAAGGECYQLSLADDHVNFESGELFIGCQDVETAMDYDFVLTEFSSDYLYFETSYDMTPGAFPTPLPDTLRYGCGEPIYKDLNKKPLNPVLPLQPDPEENDYNPGVVNVGDQRMLEVTVYTEGVQGSAGTKHTYPAGSIVTDGDLDAGRILIMLEPGLAYYDEPQGCNEPNSMYDMGELIYFDPALAAGTRATHMLYVDNGGGIERFDPTEPSDLGGMRWNSSVHGGNTLGQYNGFGAYGQSEYMGAEQASRYWYFQQCGGLGSPYAGSNPRLFNVGPAYHDHYYYVYPSYTRTYDYTYLRNCGDLLALRCQQFMGDWRLRLYEDSDMESTTERVPPISGYPNYMYYYVYYYAYFSSALVWYRGPDIDGRDVCTDPYWTNYAFNYQLLCEDYRRYTSYDKIVGMGSVLMDHDGNGYGQQYYYNQNNRSYQGWNGGSNRSRMHFFRWEYMPHPDTAVIGGRYSRAVSIGYVDPPSSGDLLAFDTLYDVRTTVFGGQWNVAMSPDIWNGDITVNLVGGNTFGSVGFSHGQYYNYYHNYYGVDAYFDNAEAYIIEVVPSAGDRRRLTLGGHHVGLNKHVYRKDDVNYSTSSASASALTPFSHYYPCGSKLAAGELYDIESVVSMVTMGKCGDPRFMDIPVLPGEVDLKVSIDGNPVSEEDEFHLKVEQTSDIQLSVDPPPQPGEKYVVRMSGVFQEGYPAREAYTDYIESRESNTFTEFCEGEVEFDKENFNGSPYLDDTYTQEFALPWDFPLYNRIIPAGTTLYVGTNGQIVFERNYAGYIPSTYGWFHRYGYPDYAILACGDDLELYEAPSYGRTNYNLHMYYCQPTPDSVRIRWETQIYPANENGPATVNFYITLYQDGTIRFTYGDMYDTRGSYSTVVSGISGDISEGEYYYTMYHNMVMNSLAYADDVVLTRFEFPPDEGRPSGGTIDSDYMIGSTTEAPHSNEIGGAHYKTVEITPENPVQHIQYTPYRGSVQEDGSCDPIKAEVFLERGGVSYPVPMDSVLSGERVERDVEDYDELNLYDYNIYDPYWVVRPWVQKMYEGRHMGDHTPRPIPSTAGIPTANCALNNQYDCYGIFELMVEPEELRLEFSDASRTCISPVDQRFPNLILKVYDGDNPIDVNDPADIPISTVGMQPGVRGKIVANVNASGAGIKYLCTAVGKRTGDVDVRYIIQVNTDGTYTFWRMYEPATDRPGAALGVLDPTDWLYSNRYPYNNVYGETNRSYNQSRLPWTDTDGWLSAITGDSTITTELEDYDCSFDHSICRDVCRPTNDGFPNLGSVTYNDRIGRFNGSYYDNDLFFSQRTGGAPFGVIETFGVPTMITNWDNNSEGGEVYVPIQPRDTDTPLQIRVYINDAVFDYNSAISEWSFDNTHPTYHPPYFVYDDSPGIDYCGIITVPVQPADKLNFTEFMLTDHGLQFSEADYTAGDSALAEMDRPAPQLRHWYNPICYNYKKDMRVYPGGQTHLARAIGSEREGGFNAYPAVSKEYFGKLGTEFYPLTDYGLYFTMVSNTDVRSWSLWDSYTFDPYGTLERSYPEMQFRIIDTIEVSGPFMVPFQWRRPNIIGSGSNQIGYIERALRSEYEYNGVENVPIRYDTSGYIKIDQSNSQYYEIRSNADFTDVVSPGFTYDTHEYIDNPLPSNGTLNKNRSLVYHSSNPYILHMPRGYVGDNAYVFAIDELIPMGPGNIEIKVTLRDGTIKIFQDCCIKPISDGIDVHGLDIKLDNEDINERGGILVDQDVVLQARVYENEKADVVDGTEWEYAECNDALVYAWQDRGIYDPALRVHVGAGDGWVTKPPKNSDMYRQAVQYLTDDDFDGDGKVSFSSHETEVIGSYDIVTNTWSGAFVDARTYQRQDGYYVLPLTEEKGSYVDTVGFDFGGFGPTGKPLPPGIRDHVVGWDETLPVWIVAYKYGDDSNDRTFRPLFDSIETNVPSMSHEVYLAGTKDLEVFPQVDLQMEYGPEPLTAGMTPELQNPETPLFFRFTDDQGNPVDFTQGVEDAWGNRLVKDEDIYKHCFIDPHPDDEYYYGIGAVLPQYYWLRTDLHNFDGTPICNSLLFSDPDEPFKPIRFDIEKDVNGNVTGRYNFTGFCANDAGEFEVYAYTPDRKHSAVATVKVAQPEIKYAVKNFETGQTFDDVDFVMTANDGRRYVITATCWDAQGSLIKGTAKEVSVCSGTGSDTARFTPYITRPQNFNWTRGSSNAGSHYGVPGYGQGYDPFYSFYIYFLIDEGDRFYPFMGVDLTNDGDIDPMRTETSELHRYTAMKPMIQSYYGIYDTWRYSNWRSPWVHYNTTNTRYDDMTYNVMHAWDLPPANDGWGWGAIYNHPYAGGYIFTDFNVDGILTFEDSLSFDQNGKASFHFWADDICEVGGLVGNNHYSNDSQFADLYGYPSWYDEKSPNYMYERFYTYRDWYGDWHGTRDYTFMLDWEAIPNRNVAVKAPEVKIFNPENGEEMSKDIFDPEAYDLTYAVRNHMIVRVYPADRRDAKVKTGGSFFMNDYRDWATTYYANEYESLIVGRLTESTVDPEAVETMIYFTPTGTGENTSSLLYLREFDWNDRASETNGFGGITFETYMRVADVVRFDSCRGLTVKAEPLNEVLRLGQPDTIVVTVTETGSGFPIEGATVALKSENGNIEMESTTDNIGQAYFNDVKPEDMSKFVITASTDEYVNGTDVLYVDVDLSPPSIDVDDFEALTKNSTVNLTGTVTKGSKLKVGTKDANVEADGKWKVQIQLVEDENLIPLLATGPNGVQQSLTLRIVLDTTEPALLMPEESSLDFFDISGDSGEIWLTGRVSPDAVEVEVTIDQGGERIPVSATIVNDVWRTDKFEVETGVEFTVQVEATDAAGNVKKSDVVPYFIAKVTKIELTVGNSIAMVNGKPVTEAIQPPVLNANGVMLVPLRQLADAFGIAVAATGNSLTITVDGKTATCTVGTNGATVDGNTFTMSTAPESIVTVVMVPLDFVHEVLKLTGKNIELVKTAIGVTIIISD